MIYVVLLYLVGYIYEDADSLIVDNDSFTICGEHTYNIKVLIRNNGHITLRPWNGSPDSTGWLVIRAPLFELNDTSSINGSYAGYQGGTNIHADGYGPGYGGSGMSGGGGGAGYGGYGGDGGDTDPGLGGLPYGSSSDTVIQMGSGGGAGRLSQIEGFGGNGGGQIVIRAQNFHGQNADIISDGEAGADAGLEAGGGGSGGGIMIWADSVFLHTVAIRANAGHGGSAAFGGGGGGGGGRIKVFYNTHLDTADLVMSAAYGLGGTGGYGDGEPGTSGTLYVDYPVGVEVRQTAPMTRFNPVMNPVSSHIAVHSESLPVTLVLYDLTGRIVKKSTLTKSFQTIPVDEVPDGVYILTAEHRTESSYKVIILH